MEFYSQALDLEWLIIDVTLTITLIFHVLGYGRFFDLRRTFLG